MNITYDELRKIKHSLPTGSIKRIAQQLELDEQTVRNYFGAQKYENGKVVSFHREAGPGGGIVSLEDDRILRVAQEILEQAN